MSDPNLIRDLAAAGLAPDLLQRVAMELARASAQQEAIEARRQNDRERQARRRHVTSREVTGHHATSQIAAAERADTSFSELKQDPPSPPKGGSVPQGTTPRKPRNRALPDDWAPGSASEAEAQQLGRSRQWMAETAKDMRIWAKGGGHVRTDWDLVHVGWMRREAKREGERPAQRAGPASASQSNHVALDRLSRNLEKSREPARPASRFDDYGPVIDHAGDGPNDRGLFEPAGGDAGQSASSSYLRVVGSRWS